MANPLFSRYSQGENRVTASILAVFERISFALVERILQILSGETNLSLLEIKNQIKSGKSGSVPDGAIQASFTYLIETKVVQSSLHQGQLTAHLSYLHSLPNMALKRLLVLTPDYQEPDVIRHLDSEWVVWASFNDLYAAISAITTTSESSETGESWLISDFPPPSEQERFLLRELAQMLLAEKLLNSGNSDAVLIVPARSAIADYHNFSVYLCQPNRSFQNVEYIGFYHDGVINRQIAKVLHQPLEAVDLMEDAIAEDTGLNAVVKQKLNELVEQLKTHNSSRYGVKCKVFFLSPPDSPATVTLAHDIRNDLRSRTGKPTAFTQGQRYVPLSALKRNPTTTTELLSSWGVS